MAIELNGTTGITTPGLTNTGTETIVNLTTTGNTILGDASTDTLNVGNGGLIKDASGNVGIGVPPSPWSGYKVLQAGIGSFIGGSSGAYLLQDNAYTDNSGAGWKYINSSYAAAQYYAVSGTHVWRTAPSGTAGNAITFTQAMTLSAAGKLGVGETNPIYTGHFVNNTDTAAASVGIIAQAATTTNQYGLYIQLAGDPNNTGNYFLSFLGSNTQRATMRSNGGLANYSANNVNLSDERVKKDIVDAGGYLDKICAIPVRTFLYKDQTDTQLNLGVIAQEVEAVAPELVDVSGFGETPEDGVPLKAIYQTDLQYALMKSIQELNAKFEEYKASHP
jgi:hypothetical protein